MAMEDGLDGRGRDTNQNADADVVERIKSEGASEGHGTVLKIVEQIGWGLYETCRAHTVMAAGILRHLFVTVYMRRRHTKRHFSHFYWALKS
jgi:hypothetical protein